MASYFHIVCYLDQVIQFHSFMYNGGAHGGTIYAGISTNLHIIFYDGNTYLWNFFVPFGRRCESESISTDYAACMQGTVVSYQAVVIDGGMWIKCTIITYFGMASYSSVRVEGSVVTNLSTIAYPGLAGMAMFVDPDNGKNILWAAVGLVISVVVSFALSFFLYKDETPAEDETAAPAPETAADAAVADSTISSPLQGKAIALEEVKDEVFSQKILGDGIAVVPEKGELYAPADGVIESVFGTKHAISMKTNAGAELLMHIGMDTVKRDGKGFDPQVKDGETVKKGQLLMKFDLDGIKADGYDVTTPIVVTNADEFTIKTVAEGAVVPGAALLKLEANK